MPVEIFVGKDTEGREWPPDHPHEVRGLIEVLSLVYKRFQPLQDLVVFHANIKLPDDTKGANADLVVFTERGLGVIEFKHHSGLITIDAAGNWFAGSKQISGGTRHTTPHQQVQAYAATIRKKVIPRLLPQRLRHTITNDGNLKLSTAVCFTNPDADITRVVERVNTLDWKKANEASWERFSVLKPKEVVNWSASLRLMPEGLGVAAKHQPLRLEPDDIVFSTQAILGGVKSDELHAVMPGSNPYGYLVMLIAGQSQMFSLIEDETSIGRSTECHIVIPDSFGSVSRHHCDIIRTTRGVRLRDAESANGTFLGSKRVRKDVPLPTKGRFVLGSATEAQGSCTLTFYLAADKPFVPQPTTGGDPNTL